MGRVFTIRYFILMEVLNNVSILIIHNFLVGAAVIARCCCISELGLVLDILLLQILLMWVHTAYMGLHLTSFSNLHTACIVLLDLNLTSNTSTADDLGRCGTVGQIRDLSRGLPAFSAHSLDVSDDFLVLAIGACVASKDVLVSLLWLVDFQLQRTVIRASSTSIWASANTSARFIVQRGLACWCVGHFRLGTLRRINTTCHGALWGVLVSNLKLLEAVIEVRTLGVLQTTLNIPFDTFSEDLLAALIRRVAIRAVVRALPVWAVLELPELLLNLTWITFLANLLALHLILLEHLLVLLLGLFELSLADTDLAINSGDLTLLLIQNALELELQFLFRLASFLVHRILELFFLLLEFFNSLIQHLDMQFQLLFYFDMVSYFCFILLELLLILFWR